MTSVAATLPNPGIAARDNAPWLSPDDALIARCVAGDKNCFRPLVERHQRMAFRVALRMLGTRADAQDAVQQAFVDAYRALDRFDSGGRENAFRGWLLRIVVNRTKDALKSKKRTETSLARDVSPGDAVFTRPPADQEQVAENAESNAALERALAGLAPKYRECLVLKDVEELSYEEMRSILRLPITTLKIRVIRARAFMRAALGKP